MANRLFGESTLKTKDGRSLTLRLDFEAMCAIEEIAGAAWDVVLSRLTDPAKPKMRTAAAVVAGMLGHHHPELADIGPAGDLYLSDGEAVTTAMQKAMAEAFGGRAARPRPGTAAKAKAPSRGTGTRSSKRGSKPA